MSGLGGFDLRALNSNDVAALQRFTCADAGSWAEEVERAIRTHVAEKAAEGPYGLSVWSSAALVAVTTWDVVGPTWHSSIVAVEYNYRRRGVGRALKSEVLALARRAGALPALVATMRANIACVRPAAFVRTTGLRLVSPADASSSTNPSRLRRTRRRGMAQPTRTPSYTTR